ncbi:hypothetical protein SAMN05216556_1362 [Aequorivita viscosa]|nr:hypothetical protein SAMN05216556_1362 [Aequorivita viscosa]
MMKVLKEGALVLKTAGTVIDNGLSPQTTPPSLPPRCGSVGDFSLFQKKTFTKLMMKVLKEGALVL